MNVRKKIKNKMLSIRVSEQHRELINLMAKQKGMSVSNYLMMLVIQDINQSK